MERKEASPSRYKLAIDPKFGPEQRTRLPPPTRRNATSRSIDTQTKDSITQRLQLSLNFDKSRSESLLPKIHPDTTNHQPNSKGSLSNLRASITSTQPDESSRLDTQEPQSLKPQPFFPTEVRAMIQRTLRRNQTRIRTLKILEEDEIVKKEVAEKHQFFKDYKRIAELGETHSNFQSPAQVFLKNCHSMNLLPHPLKMFRDNGAAKKIKLRLVFNTSF